MREFEKRQHEAAYGKGKPIIHAQINGFKFVAVGNELHWIREDKCRFFPDFLSNYLKKQLTPEWYAREYRKPYEERHQIAKWYLHLCQFQSGMAPDETGAYVAEPCGAALAWYRLAYDLYQIRHNTSLQEKVLDRLKHKDQFQGARHELCVAAAFIAAAFDINYEDETDVNGKHAEFVAIDKASKISISVEAKSRHRNGVLDFSDPNATGDKVGVRGLLMAAYKKDPKQPFIVCVDVNLPASEVPIHESDWFREVRDTIDGIEGRWPVNEFPANGSIFVNDPSHYTLDTTPPGDELGTQFWCFGTMHKSAKYALPDGDWLQRVVLAFQQRANVPNHFPQTADHPDRPR